jgi:type III pantothenate kinase
MFKPEKDYVIIDAGNTAIKLAIIRNGKLAKVDRFSSLGQIIPFIANKVVVCISVTHQNFKKLVEEHNGLFFQISHNLQLPFKSEYTSMHTIGIDRLCNVAATVAKFPGRNSLIIDIGTCIKFDFLSADNLYRGGSIAPGISLRYQSLHEHTSKLPLLDLKGHTDIIGNNTTRAIHSGVINGIRNEIEGLISRYEHDFDDLQILITGGDASYFDFPQKSNIFANKNLTLEGIVEIYEINTL